LNTIYDAIVIGAGQAGLATGYYLQQAGFRFLILEAGRDPVGSWPRFYDSLSLNSAARYSSLPGLPFPGDPDRYPARDEVVAYLCQYATHFRLPVVSEARVSKVKRAGQLFEVVTDDQNYFVTRTLVAATGFFGHPYFPDVPGLAQFRGQVLHTANYHNPEPFRDQRVVIVGSANGAVQIGMELAEVARVTLAVRHPIHYLPQRFLGRDIHFWLTVSGLDRTQWLGDNSPPVFDSGAYRQAIAAGQPDQRPMFERFSENGVVWSDGRPEAVDTIIFATGYRPNLPYLAGLGALDETGRVLQRQGMSTTVPGLYFVGLPRQRNVASATLRGAGVDAKIIVDQLWQDSQAQARGKVSLPQFRASGSSELVGLVSLISLAAKEQLATGNVPAFQLVGEAVTRSAMVGAGFLGFGSATALYSRLSHQSN
jgi:putative flavoprotein involved in K+ transport